MDRIFFDTETVGLTGPLVTIQYAFAPTNINIHNVWTSRVNDTLALIEGICEKNIVGFNLTFDWFQLSKWYNVLRKTTNKTKPPQIGEVKNIERLGPSNEDYALKPISACDLMLLARSNRFQYLAPHKNVLIRKVPVSVRKSFYDGAMDKYIQLPKGVSLRWRESKKVTKRTDAVDIILEFKGLSTSLKNLTSIISGEQNTGSFEQVVGLAPYKDVPSWRPWGGEWTSGLQWLLKRAETDTFKLYAKRDVEYTYNLWKYLGEPVGGDDDSELACLIGTSHWYGFSIDNEAVERLLQEKAAEAISAPTAPAESIAALRSVLSKAEQIVLTDTKKKTLEEFTRWDGHPVQSVAMSIIRARKAQSRKALLEKLHASGAFYFSMKVEGTLSSRMSGESGMNAQGIPQEKQIRELFTLKWENEQLSGGDFDAFEVSIADAVYKDPQLKADLTSGQKFHGITGATFYGKSYDEILATRDYDISNSLYKRAKNAFFGYLYGAQLKKFADTLGLNESEASSSLERIRKRYPVIAAYRGLLSDKYLPLSQHGIGTKVIWHEPCDYIESILGFRRFFTLENAVLRGMYRMTESPPEEWKIDGTCRRSTREQTIENATRSAILSCIFGLQSHIFRAACNHEIQSPGAQITKSLQRAIWGIQRSGLRPFMVRPFNIHDEVNVCYTVSPELIHKARDSVINKYIDRIPLLKMSWKDNLDNWGNK